jgi:hypothetical protein
MCILTIMAAYQFSIMQQMVSKLAAFEARLNQFELFLDDSDNTHSKVELTNHPHERYFHNIPMKDGTNIPLHPDREYTYDDFESVFNVLPLHEQIMTDEVAELLKDHNPTTDNYFLDYKTNIMDRYEEFKAYLEGGSHEMEDREKFVIKWASPESGFGMFAKKDVYQGEIVGNYVGLVTGDKRNTDYMWGYITTQVGDQKVDMGIDSRIAGNYLRFVNHAGKDANTLVIFC